MKLYVKRTTGVKVYLKQIATTRQELVDQLGEDSFTIDGEVFSVLDVIAESSEKIAGAMATGGVVGVIGGVPGVLIGGIIGALLGKGTDDEDKIKSDKFNGSSL